MTMSSQQQMMVERVDELERMIVRLNGRIGELQRELNLTKGMTGQGWGSAARLRAIWGGSKPVVPTAHPVRENRRVERHEHCLF
ncbi:MAG: hypothetical protein H8K06_08490 [Nitrospira sp.]|nr:hypothetical protein [Nitrospira defluvii]MCS6327108.1 hypothetical protein [Nitrospira sp.]